MVTGEGGDYSEQYCHSAWSESEHGYADTDGSYAYHDAYGEHASDGAGAGNDTAYHTYTEVPVPVGAGAWRAPVSLGWVLDTGATSHFTNDVHQLSGVEPAASTVQTADGSVTAIVEKGVAHVSTPAGRITLKDVHHAPLFSRPLISVTKLVDKDRAVTCCSSKIER